MKRITMARRRVTRRQFLEDTARGAGAATLVIVGLGAAPAHGKKASRKKASRKKSARRKKGNSRRNRPEEVTSFFDVDEYLDAVGEEFLFLDFDPAPTEPGLVSGDFFSSEIIFSSPEASDPSKVVHSGTAGNGAISDAGSTSAPNGVGPIAGVFPTPVHAFAFDILSLTTAL
jgi:hypothetical protein